MKNAFYVPYRSEQEINIFVNSFLNEWQFLRDIPIDVEYIAERVGFHIVPIISSIKSFKGCLFLKTMELGIKFSFFEDNRENIYRFTIAHELAHYVLHRDIYSQFSGTSIEEWTDFYLKNSQLIDRAERQADIFAGFLLMPLSELMEDLEDLNKKYERYEDDIRKDRLELEISRKYKVSLKTAQIQLMKVAKMRNSIGGSYGISIRGS